ncbi:M56 family metallopeptidase [Enterococcus sp. 669A]|uniref:M56 family metallopeptidase n=1 Tax=Candidatus Enterococcus moelleringii TaxID=2815325 RepID=A0ABS3L5Z7_9ENTE|nr:M56 family metallopeptidase [Enterococcus sp. 669A]MBO1305038.1 M56 family metallopeptidase [Enterococcus sp. 669A]
MIDFMVALFSCSLGMSLMMAMFLVLVRFFQQRFSPRFFYYLSVALLFGFAIPFRVKLPHFLIGRTVNPSNTVSLQENIVTAVQENTVLETGKWYSMVDPVFTCWLIVAALILIYYVVQHVEFTRTLNRWIESDDHLLSKLDISTDLKTVRCKCITTPMLVQLDQPTILLPDVDYSPEELALIIQHEEIHFLRKDWLLRGVMIFAVALHWFNPLVYVLARQMTKWCEISCDEEVTKNLSRAQRYKYADIILETVRRQSKQSMLSSLLSDGKHELQQRLSFIVETRKRPFNADGLVVCLLLILGGSTAISLPTSAATGGSIDISIPEGELSVEEYYQTEAERKAEFEIAMSEVFSNEFKESDFAGMTISYDERGVPIVRDPNAEERNHAISAKTKKRLTSFYSSSSCDKDSLYFQVERDNIIGVTAGGYGYKAVKVKYAGKTGYMKSSNITFRF